VVAVAQHFDAAPDLWVNEVEPIATFFLRLPETLAIPSRTPLRDLYKIGPRLRQILEGDDIHKWVDKSERSKPRNGPIPRNMIRAHVMTASMVVHQVKVDLSAVLGFDATFDALKLGVPDGSERQVPEELAGSRMEGSCSVAEVSIPLQLMAAVRASESTQQGFILPDPDFLDEALFTEAFDAAVEYIRRVQSMYYAITRVPVTLLTTELLPPLVPFVIRNPRQIAEGENVDVRLMGTNISVGRFLEVPELDADQMDALFLLGRRNQTLMIYLDLHRQAAAALYLYGNTRESVVMIAAAAEAILKLVICHMQWEEGMTPEASVRSWPEGLLTRIKSMFSPRLGGSWDPTRGGQVGRWAREAAGVRNRVVHAGYTPSREEGERAMVVVEELVGYIGDRLAYGGNLRKYPRTALELFQPDGLRRRGRFPRWLQELQDDRAEPPWHATFGAWYATHLRLMGDRESPRRSSNDHADVLAVFNSAKEFQWVLHDVETGQAAEAAIVLASETEDPINTFAGLLIFGESSGVPRYPISVQYERGAEISVERTGPWVEQYHLVPQHGAMVDLSDFMAAWPLPTAKQPA
jgi:hypothetical protein